MFFVFVLCRQLGPVLSPFIGLVCPGIKVGAVLARAGLDGFSFTELHFMCSPCVKRRDSKTEPLLYCLTNC